MAPPLIRTAGSYSRHLLIASAQSNNSKTPQRTTLPKKRPNFPAIFGTNGEKHQVSLYDQLSDDGIASALPLSLAFELSGGSGRLWSPCLQLSVSAEDYSSLPFMFYLPGFDGTGLTGHRMHSSVMEAFDFMTFTIPLEDRSSFTELVDLFLDALKECIGENSTGRPVYLLGESFGGLLALAAAYKCPELIDRVVLVNPATSYEQSIWPFLGPLVAQLPDELYSGIAFALAPLLGNPLALMAYKVDLSQPIPTQLDNLIEVGPAISCAFKRRCLQGVVELFGTLGFISDIARKENVLWKIDLVKEGVQVCTPIIPKVQQRTLLLVSDGDWMLPSAGEKDRLESLMRRCYARSMGPRSHALLQEGGVDLVEVLKEEEFYVTRRRFSAQNGKSPKLNAFGTPFPIELPTEKDRQRASFLVAATSLLSPVFYTTTSDNRVVAGLEAFPDAQPLLIVGNHQLMAQDSFILIDQFLKETGILLRGMAHPLTLDMATEGGKYQTLMPPGMGIVKNAFPTFGVVKVSGRNLYTLLSQGERIVMYPGGAREGFKRKNEKYKLFWPEKAEFVRMAAKFGATIVTLASVGYEDSVEIVMDRDDFLQTPILKDVVQRQIQSMPEARPGISQDIGDDFLPPLIRPKVPQRLYYLFGNPFVTTSKHYNDRELSQKLYTEIKDQLEENIAYLQTKSNEDPYRDFVKRAIYENTNGNGKAPSFLP